MKRDIIIFVIIGIIVAIGGSVMGYRLGKEFSPVYSTTSSEYQPETKGSIYYLKNLDGYVVIYTENTIYDYTDIQIDLLDWELQEKINMGYPMDSLSDVYDFLEDISS